MNPLKRARVDRGWSQARAIVAIETEARALRYVTPERASLKTQLSRWENGHRAPDHKYQRVLQRVYGLSAVQLGFEPADATGLGTCLTWEECAESTPDLWSADMQRRTFLQSAAFAASAFAGPALAALISDGADAVVRTTGDRPVSPQDVTLIRDVTRQFAQLDNRHGGGRVRPLALSCLNNQITPMLRAGQFDSSTGRALLCVTAELNQLVGWMTHDIGRHSLAQRYLIQALDLAKSAGDRQLVSELLSAMSQQSTYLGQREGIDLARAAGKVAAQQGNGALVAEARVMEAHAHAKAASPAACAASLHAAEIALDRADRTTDPQWISYFDEAYMSAKFGHCFRELGDTAQRHPLCRAIAPHGQHLRARSRIQSDVARTRARRRWRHIRGLCSRPPSRRSRRASELGSSNPLPEGIPVLPVRSEYQPEVIELNARLTTLAA